MTSANKKNNDNIGFILPTVVKFIDLISKQTSRILLFKSGKDFESDIYVIGKQGKTVHRSDLMNLIWFFVSLVIYYIIVNWAHKNESEWWKLLLIPIILRQINIVSWILRPIFIQPHNNTSMKLINITSYQRNLLYAFIHYIELIVLFASIYAFYNSSLLTGSAQIDSYTYLYYSGVSQLTIGYGDISPKDFLRLVVLIQAIIGLLIFAVTVGTLIGRVNIKDEVNEKNNSTNG